MPPAFKKEKTDIRNHEIAWTHSNIYNATVLAAHFINRSQTVYIKAKGS